MVYVVVNLNPQVQQNCQIHVPKPIQSDAAKTVVGSIVDNKFLWTNSSLQLYSTFHDSSSKKMME